MATYNGIELHVPEKEPTFSHSRFMETDRNIDWMDRLCGIDKQSLSITQFLEVSRLNSVANLNYQVCNGGVGQYVFNGYDLYTDPYNEQDCAQLPSDAQAKELREIAKLGMALFPDKADENAAVLRVADDFGRLDLHKEPPENPYDEDYEPDEYRNWEDEMAEGDWEPPAFDTFERAYYEVNPYLELLIELRAQFLAKSIEASPSDPDEPCDPGRLADYLGIHGHSVGYPGSPADCIRHVSEVRAKLRDASPDLESESRDMESAKDALAGENPAAEIDAPKTDR